MKSKKEDSKTKGCTKSYVEEYIKSWCDIANKKPYDYGKFWKMYSGLPYSYLNRIQKIIWRESVKNVAEYNSFLMSPEWYLKN